MAIFIHLLGVITFSFGLFMLLALARFADDIVGLAIKAISIMWASYLG
jgi:hypothetical protein